MDKLSIAFYIGKSRENPNLRFWDKLICFFDGSKFSHAELVLMNYADGTSLCASSSVRDGGIRFKRMKLTHEHWEIIPIYGDRGYATRWMTRREGKKYDFLGLIRTYFNWAPDNQKRYFCSEAVAGMLGLEDPASYGLRKLFKTANEHLNRLEDDFDLRFLELPVSEVH